jgi:hypothetical protein
LSEIEDNLNGGWVENEVYDGVGGDIGFHIELEWSQCLCKWNRCGQTILGQTFQLIHH